MRPDRIKFEHHDILKANQDSDKNRHVKQSEGELGDEFGSLMEEDAVGLDGFSEDPDSHCQNEQHAEKQQANDNLGFSVVGGIGPHADSQDKQKDSAHINDVLIDEFGKELNEEEKSQGHYDRDNA